MAAAFRRWPKVRRSYHVQIPNPELIVANQNCQNWCWAASSEMLVRSQRVFNVSQEVFVQRIYGPALPCLPSFGSFEPIKQAIDGIYIRPDGSQVALTGTYHYGVPTDVAGMIRSITDGRPFIFAWQGHAWIAYGIKYFYTGPLTIQFTEIELIDPLAQLSNGTRPQFYSFVVGRDNFAEINGTFELLVLSGQQVLGPPMGGGQQGGDDSPAGVVLPGGVQLPGGVVLPGGAVFPGGATLPGGVVLPPGTTGVLPGGQPLPGGGQAIAGPAVLPPNTTLPGGVVLPGGATVPPGGATLPGGAILPVNGEPLPPATVLPNNPILPNQTVLPGGAMLPSTGAFLPGGAVLPNNTVIAPGFINVPQLPAGTVLPGGAFFIGGGAVLPGGAVFSGGPFTLFPLIQLIHGPHVIDEPPVIDDPEPIDEDLSGDDPRDEVMTVDNEPTLALSPQ